MSPSRTIETKVMCTITGKHNSQPMEKGQTSNPLLTIKQISCEEKYEGKYCKLFLSFFYLEKENQNLLFIDAPVDPRFGRDGKFSTILLIKVN